MSTEETILMIHQLNEAFLNNDETIIDQIIAPDYVDHPLGLTSREEYKQYEHDISQALSNMNREITRITVDGDLVWFRFSLNATHTGNYMGIKTTNKEINGEGMVIYRIHNGKVVEKIDQVLDLMDFYTKLGVVEYKGFPEKSQ